MSDIITQIANCPDKPNCVSTLTKSKDHKVEPWALTKNTAEVLKAVKDEVSKLSRTELIKETGNSLHFVFTSKIFRYKDDVWFYVDQDNKQLQFKSASRVGYSDLGANKKRMDKLRALLNNKI